MPKVKVTLDVDLVLDVMVLSGIRNPQDAVEAIVRDYVARGHRTETITGDAADRRGSIDPPSPFPGG
jgi:Arc/MetJ family transcription regulator